MPRLRGHHLVCLHFFHGEGYDERFIKNLKNIIAQAEKETVIISSGADDVCIKCIYLKKGRCESTDNADKAIQKMDNKALALLGLSEGDRVTWSEIKDGAGDIFSDWYFQYCTECEWKETCERDEYFNQLLHKL